MASIEEDDTREERIMMEIIVDAYGPEEQAMGWYCYLEEHIQFPFEGQCIKERAISPLRTGEQVTVIGMLPEKECEYDMLVEIRFADRTMGVPLSQIKPIHVDEDTQEAIDDWHYWIARGHRF